ncbi:1-acyl-sn-glycerol-3-phosphate acyltransferase [Nitratireductor sp. CAU 1489]|uniref:1-acyl-sn-glycerol-3-phosphate acyltransferase n=1 Tax=Nitratireductor arenosus TaxID=2682096 RepID=A0A844QGF7_9HYPH|nr:1-acyl-sn-glycerol-3-phosphate acyltransferase [Nitratireductor arenosus]MVA98197.1 1-acyl-sn-glycerol-3-phosphate acyltransferase [Nitratireductor arenosus]
MMASIRAAIVLAVLLPVTLVAIGVQMIALRIGVPDPGMVPTLWHGLALRLLGIRVRVHGAADPRRPLLIASNHISWTDIPVLGAIMPLGFVAKADMAGWPVFGLLAKLQRTVFVERDRARTSAIQAGALGARLATGDVMVLFAEGTTSDGNFVAPFKSTLFAAAQAALDAHADDGQDGVPNVTIQPVAIAYTRLHGMPMGRFHRRHASWIGDADLIPHLGALIREGGMDVEVHFGVPVRFEPGSDRKQVARRVEAEIRGLMVQALRRPGASSR